MRDARTGGNKKPQLISEHGAGQKSNKKPRPFHAAALKQADAHERKQRQVQQVVDNYAANPRESARKLRELGMKQDFIRAIHKSAVPNKNTRPAPGAPGFRGLAGGLDSAVEFAIGGRPSHAPGNILANLGLGTHGLPHDEKPTGSKFKRPLTTDEFHRFQETGAAPLSAIEPQVSQEIFPFTPGGFRLGGLSRKAKTTLPKGVTEITRERTSDEATKRLAQLDKQYEKMVKDVTAATQGKPSDFADLTRRRNLKAKKRANRGLPPLPKVSAEMRSRAETHLAKASEGDTPTAKKLKALLVERENLRNAINERALPLDGGATSLGTTKQTMKFPGEMPEDVQAAAGRLASQLDKDSVKALRKEQERLHTQERGKRGQAAHAMLIKYAGTEKANRIAKSMLAGEMPRVPVSKVLGEMSAEDLGVLRKYVDLNPRMSPYDKINVKDALDKGLSGRPPTDRERELLHKAFGKEFSTRLEMPSLGTKVMRGAKEVANLPRSVESSGDVSATLRQNLVAVGHHPVIASKNFGPGLKAFANKGYAERRLRAIEQRPNYKNGYYRRAKLALTDVGDSPGPHEELFPSALGDKIPLVKQSGRSFTDTTNNNRVDIFDREIKHAKKKGVDVEDNHFLESLGRMVNSETGRGDLGSLEGVGKVLNATLFSPRLLKSRLDFLNPVYYAKLHPHVRVQAARAALQTIAGGVFILELANKAGAGVELDPRSTDFGKARFGSTRIDVWGGFQPVVRTIAQIATGERKTTTSGDIVKLDGKFGHSTRLDTLFNFAVGKAAPVPSIGLDLLRGKTFVGQPVTLKGEAWQRGVPFGVQDAVDVARSKNSALKGTAAFGLSAVGVGVQDYTNDPSKVAKKTHDELSKALEENVRHYFKRGLTPQVKRALDLRLKRQVYLAKHLGSNPSALDRFNAQIDLLTKLGIGNAAKATHAKAWAAKQDDHTLRSEASKINHKYFGGVVLSDVTKKIRERGGKFYLSDKDTWKP